MCTQRQYASVSKDERWQHNGIFKQSLSKENTVDHGARFCMFEKNHIMAPGIIVKSIGIETAPVNVF